MAGSQRGKSVRRETPLRVDELERVAMDPRLPGDREAAQVLLSRMVATLREQQDQARSLRAEVDRLRRHQSDSSHPMQRALDAIAALDDDQRREILDRNYLAAVSELERQGKEAMLAQVAARNYRLRVQHLLGCLLDEELPAPVRERIRQVLEAAGEGGQEPGA